MDSVIIASKNSDEANLIKNGIKNEYEATQIPSPDDFDESINGTKLISFCRETCFFCSDGEKSA